MTAVEVQPGVWLHPTGALWLPDCGAALVADLHLGYAWALRRRGQLGPLVGGGVAERLQVMLEELQPKHLILLGDLVHAPRPSAEERAEVEARLTAIRQQTEVLLVKGNHDRGFERDFAHLGLAVTTEWRAPGWRAVHGDNPVTPTPGERLAVGHFHPAIGLRDAAGARRRTPAALIYPRLIALPAFSPLAAGVDVRRAMPPELQALTGGARGVVYAVTGSHVVRVAEIGR